MSTPAVTLTSFETRHEPQDSIPNRLWIRQALIFLLLGGVALWLGPSADPEDWWLHGLWCFAGLAVALPTLSYAFLQRVGVVLTDHRLMFLAAFSLYFLFGAALLAVRPENQIELTMSFYPIDVNDALRVDAINGLGFGLALLSATLVRGHWLEVLAGRLAAVVAGARVIWVISLFLLLGSGASFYVLSFDLGISEGFLPGLVRSAGNFSLVVIFLAVAHRGTGERVLRVLGSVLAVTLMIGGTLLFSKFAALIPLAVLTAGMAVRFGPRRILPVGLSLMLAAFATLGDITDYGRASLGSRGTTTLAERWEIVQNAWTDTRDLSEGEEYHVWARLCYTTAQAAALALSDAGQGGDGFSLIPWVFVPRLLVPEKPEITVVGVDFYKKITNQEGTSVGQGIFVSGYYHGGWWGFFFASVLCGWIVAQTSAIARAVMANHALLMLPFVLLGLLIAFRIDGDFVSDYLGAFIFILYPILASLVLPESIHGRGRSSGWSR